MMLQRPPKWIIFKTRRERRRGLYVRFSLILLPGVRVGSLVDMWKVEFLMYETRSSK